ncbi:hypothetical protein BN946_scf185016.g17 [Trametes cinnabarina]|uniref:F-box domain-containing protein n=1 Tax=Pycnoporus cinnabarinus TaxID=5643 RepID=A0A060SHK7_PYCCI|nr:hypothetical protein BN946_scf185016.g17 [Trametes cinnabarina]
MSNLHPLDLLHVSRASKQLRAILMSRRTRFIWAASLATVDELPPCPDDMSGPAYAALLFTRICTLCGANHACWVDYAIRLRLCKSCHDAHIKSGRTILAGQDVEPEMERFYMGMVPCETGKDLATAKRLEEPFAHSDQDKYYAPQLREALTVTEKLLELGYSRDDFPLSREWRNLLDQRKTLTERAWKTLRPKLEEMIQERKREDYEWSIREDVNRRNKQIAGFYEEFIQSLSEAEQALMPGAHDACQLPCLASLARRNDAKGDVSLEEFQALTDQVLQEAEAYKVRAKEAAVKQLIERANWCAHEEWLRDLQGLTPDEALQRYYALFRCNSRQRCDVKYVAFEDMHRHFRTAHPWESWGTSWRPDHEVFECAVYPRDSANILKAVGLPTSTPLSVLDKLIKAGRLYCSCRDPDLPPPEELDWPQLYVHVNTQEERYHKLHEQRLRSKDANQDMVMKETHPLYGPNPCLKLLPEGADTQPARDRAAPLDPTTRAKVEQRLAAKPEPTAIALCSICTNMTMKRYLRHGGEGVRTLPKTLEGIVHHIREWHEKDFEDRDIVFFKDRELISEQ